MLAKIEIVVSFTQCAVEKDQKAILTKRWLEVELIHPSYQTQAAVDSIEHYQDDELKIEKYEADAENVGVAGGLSSTAAPPAVQFL